MAIHPSHKHLDSDASSTRRRARGGLAITTSASLLAMGLTVSPLVAQDAGQAVDVDTTRAALEKWVETRRIISEEKRDWQLGREVLEERIELVQREIEEVRQRIEQAKASITEADTKRQELVDQNESLKVASESLADKVDGLEAGVKTLLARLPEPAADNVKPLSRQLPKDGEEITKSLSQRFQNVIGILNMVNKFHREVKVTSEVRTLPDGSSIEVAAMYLGVAQGYYVGANDSAAAVGSSSEDGWVWTPANEIAAQVSQSIAILNNEEPADFIGLPIEVK